MRILIVRHAEPDYSHDSLTEKGFKEAELLPERLSKNKISAIYCSPCGRAKRTAEPTAKSKNQEIRIMDWLTEFQGKIIDKSGHETIPWNQEPQAWSLKSEFYNANTWLDNESMSAYTVPDKYKWVTDSFDRLLSKYGYRRNGIIYSCKENRDDTIILFCHFALGMVLVSHLTGISPVLLWQTMFLPTSSVTTFVTEEREKGEVVFKCVQMGDTSHLYAAGEKVSRSGLYPEFFGGEGCGPQA